MLTSDMVETVILSVSDFKSKMETEVRVSLR